MILLSLIFIYQKMLITTNVRLNCYFSMKKHQKYSNGFFTTCVKKKSNMSKNAKNLLLDDPRLQSFTAGSTIHLGPFIYYVGTFLGFLDPLPPPLREHVFSTENKQKMQFSNTRPLTNAYVSPVYVLLSRFYLDFILILP